MVSVLTLNFPKDAVSLCVPPAPGIRPSFTLGGAWRHRFDEEIMSYHPDARDRQEWDWPRERPLSDHNVPSGQARTCPGAV